MTESAIEDRRARTQRDIGRCARRLALEHGLDGFTMDDLAVAVGVSRRTLFNYVPGKIDAVLGQPVPPSDEVIETFLSGGPTGHLMTDAVSLIAAALDSEDVEAGDMDALRTLIRTEHRLHSALQERFADITAQFVEAIAEREGAAHHRDTARIITTLTLGLLDVALDRSLADPNRTLAEHYQQVVETSVDLFSRTGR